MSEAAGGSPHITARPIVEARSLDALTPTVDSTRRRLLRAIRIQRQSRGALYGGIGAGVCWPSQRAHGKYGTASLSPQAKGRLGETLSYAKSVALATAACQNSNRNAGFGGRKTITDQALKNDRLLEAKFGPWARHISRMDRGALRHLGHKYLIDHYLPKDVGDIFSAGSSILIGSSARPRSTERSARKRP